jgi:ferric-dicitrate binding protein FerR (iron transport regulator)
VAEYEGMDALMAAITDEPVPEEAHDDAEFMAEHRAAVADVALLRAQLTALGDAWAEQGEERKPAPRRTPRKRTRRPERAPRNRGRRPLALAVGTLATAAVGAMVVGMGWLIAQGGAGGANDSASASKADSGDAKGAESSLSAPGYLACSRLIAEGTVAEVEPVTGTGQDRITLDVDRYYKPDKGKDQVTFVMDEDVDPRLHKGDHVLVGIPRNSASPDIWSTREKDIAHDRAWILKALPQSRGLACE